MRLARQFVKSEASAEDVLQDAWLGVLAGLEAFEQRSSFRTWFFSIVVNCARKRATKEAKLVPFSTLTDAPDSEPAVAASRFAEAGRWPDHWAEAPSPWPLPDEAALGKELAVVVDRAIEALPAGQREVVTLRDVLGLSAPETCEAVGISEANQRVLLHRGRARVRAALEETLGWAP